MVDQLSSEAGHPRRRMSSSAGRSAGTAATSRRATDCLDLNDAFHTRLPTSVLKLHVTSRKQLEFRGVKAVSANGLKPASEAHARGATLRRIPKDGLVRKFERAAERSPGFRLRLDTPPLWRPKTQSPSRNRHRQADLYVSGRILVLGFAYRAPKPGRPQSRNSKNEGARQLHRLNEGSAAKLARRRLFAKSRDLNPSLVPVRRHPQQPVASRLVTHAVVNGAEIGWSGTESSISEPGQRAAESEAGKLGGYTRIQRHRGKEKHSEGAHAARGRRYSVREHSGYGRRRCNGHNRRLSTSMPDCNFYFSFFRNCARAGLEWRVARRTPLLDVRRCGIAAGHDVPVPFRRPPDREICFPVVIEVAGYRHVARHAPLFTVGRCWIAAWDDIQIPFEGRQTAKSILPSPSKSPVTGMRLARPTVG